LNNRSCLIMASALCRTGLARQSPERSHGALLLSAKGLRAFGIQNAERSAPRSNEWCDENASSKAGFLAFERGTNERTRHFNFVGTNDSRRQQPFGSSEKSGSAIGVDTSPELFSRPPKHHGLTRGRQKRDPRVVQACDRPGGRKELLDRRPDDFTRRVTIGERRSSRGFEKNRRIADLKTIAWEEHHLGFDALPIHRRSVAAPQVADLGLPVFDHQPHVASRNLGIFETDGARRAPADDDLPIDLVPSTRLRACK
jgi:hypothetical protein